MNAMSKSFPDARTLQLASGLRLEVFEAGQGPLLVLCHGFPELAYSWRHQFPALTRAGFRVAAPNQRGYGGSDAPREVEAYHLEHLCTDLAELLDALEVEKAVFVGHDWGGFVAWAMPLCYPERCLGVVGVNTPYLAFPGTELLGKVFPDPEKNYILWFQEPGVAERVLEAQTPLVFEKLMRGATEPPDTANLAESADANPFRRLPELESFGKALLSADELQVYVDAFTRSGFSGPINWYRNIDRNLELLPELGIRNIDLPCLQITAAWDLALPPALADGMSERCSDLVRVDIDACGHWTQQEKPEEVNRALVDWLTPRFGQG